MSENLEYINNEPFSKQSIVYPGATSGEVVKILDLSYEYITSIRDEIELKYWTEWYEYLLRESIWKSKFLLLFDDFYEFPWVRNNIHCFFFENYVGEAYRSQDFYKKFARENSDLEKRLRKASNGKSIFHKKTQVHIEMLYKAYEIMFSYDEVWTNHNLFG